MFKTPLTKINLVFAVSEQSLFIRMMMTIKINK